jgi:hypothetical protein
MFKPDTLRSALPFVSIYAALSLGWIIFAYGAVPNIIELPYNGNSFSLLILSLQGQTSLKYCAECYGVIAGAVQIAIILHLIVVLFIRSIDRKYELTSVKSISGKTNVILIGFSAVFLAVTVLSGIHGDYPAYLKEWLTVLTGRIPWSNRLNAYGPLFNVLALSAWINPLTNKLLFAFSYLVYIVWLIKDFAQRRGLDGVSWACVAFWFLNPFPWVVVAYFGYFDVLVGILCVAAVHSLIVGNDRASGAYLGIGILLKYIPIVILPFLIFNKKSFSFRVLSYCLGFVIFGMLVSILAWGKLTFLPLAFAATRDPHFSIYHILTSSDWASSHAISFDWLEKPFLATAGLGLFTWCWLRKIGAEFSASLSVLVTLQFYRIGFINYQMVPFILISYLVIYKWQQLLRHFGLMTILTSYFGVISIMELIHWTDLVEVLYIEIVVTKFVLGCILIVVLLRFSRSDGVIGREAAADEQEGCALKPKLTSLRRPAAQI